MDAMFKTVLWQQFGSAIDMFTDAIYLCPEDLWTAAMWKDEDDARFGQFWYIAAHTLMWLDLFLGGTSKGFTPPEPFLRGRLPDTPYTKPQILTYLAYCRDKCQSTIENMTQEQAFRLCPFDWFETTFYGLLMYCMRHVQEHGAQLNLFLGQHGIVGMDWVSVARDKLIDITAAN